MSCFPQNFCTSWCPHPHTNIYIYAKMPKQTKMQRCIDEIKYMALSTIKWSNFHAPTSGTSIWTPSTSTQTCQGKSANVRSMILLAPSLAYRTLFMNCNRTASYLACDGKRWIITRHNSRRTHHLGKQPNTTVACNIWLILYSLSCAKPNKRPRRTSIWQGQYMFLANNLLQMSTCLYLLQLSWRRKLNKNNYLS